ncbi:hypothetical protein QFC19_007456 [Naganishia cerealis]|uniref:Uncharacterized protein n=1 Tax=Naganishia cerealis TaxID=610337 RepID=A0ACC2V9E6_9TREE|nr:hypothetical protein QFC19_007456 [Naganishia cerealis]
MLSFNGSHVSVATSPHTFSKSTRIHHYRTPSLSSTSSATVSSTEDELPTDTDGASPAIANSDVELGEEVEDDDDTNIVDVPKTPVTAMMPTTPTDRFTRLNVCARRMKGDRFLPKRLRSSGDLRDAFHGVVAGISPRSAGAFAYHPPPSPSPLPSKHKEMPSTIAPPQQKDESESADDLIPVKAQGTTSNPGPNVDANPSAIRKVMFSHVLRHPNAKSRLEARHQPYVARQPSPCGPGLLWRRREKEDRVDSKTDPFKLKTKLSMESLPPALKGKLGEENKQWLLVGPGIARHLQMGGNVLVRDFAGNAVGWMA